MARGAHASPYHFSRLVAREAGEPPVALRRRVLLERAAWRLAGGATVTEVALEAGYDSTDGFGRAFARAYGHPPSATTSGTATWLAAPNGIHFHPPTNLWVREPSAGRARLDPVLAVQLHHGVADTTLMLEAARGLDAAAYRRPLLPGHRVHAWGPPEESVAALLQALVFSQEVWVASIEGADHPGAGTDDLDDLRARHAVAGPRWVAAVADVVARDAWDDRLVDALCEPPESFVLSGVGAHVLQYGAHRRLLVRRLLRELGALDDAPPAPDLGDPVEWVRQPIRQPSRQPTRQEHP
ncbi:AraC family transcriptional regulator [Nocardioides sp. ChNu-153]|nr:AraC family transcriptional regulator [Nocardioides sp. ChNu-153]